MKKIMTLLFSGLVIVLLSACGLGGGGESGATDDATGGTAATGDNCPEDDYSLIYDYMGMGEEFYIPDCLEIHGANIDEYDSLYATASVEQGNYEEIVARYMELYPGLEPFGDESYTDLEGRLPNNTYVRIIIDRGFSDEEEREEIGYVSFTYNGFERGDQ